MSKLKKNLEKNVEKRVKYYPKKKDKVLKIDGFQIEEKITCDAIVNDNVLSVRFVSHSNGSTVNDFGVAIYKVNEELLSIKKSNKRLITKWGAESPGDKLPVEGIYFKLK